MIMGTENAGHSFDAALIETEFEELNCDARSELAF